MNDNKYLTLYNQIQKGDLLAEEMDIACYETLLYFYRKDDFAKSMTILINYEMYLNENNIQDRPIWHNYYTLMILGKAHYHLFLQKPDWFWDNIKILEDSHIDTCALLTHLLFYYIEMNSRLFDFFRSSLHSFVNCFFQRSAEFSQKTIDVLKYIKSTLAQDKEQFTERRNTFNLSIAYYSDLSSQKNLQRMMDRIEEVDTDTLFQWFQLPKDDKKSLVIIGDTKLNQSDIFKIVEDFGYTSKQVIIYNDYDKLTNTSFDHLTSSKNCVGIICGPLPHNTKSKGAETSLIAALEKKAKVPVVCATLKKKDKLCLSKSSLQIALARICSAYLMVTNAPKPDFARSTL